jgi:uncharacterized RDD family membrane protein YckC
MDQDLRYAGFFRRLTAGLIDFLLRGVVTLGVGWLASQSKLSAYIVLPLLWLAVLLYEPYFHATLGATVGKLAVRVRVVTVDGERIGWKAALIRSSPFIVMMMYWSYCVTASIDSMPPDDFQGQGWSDLFQLARRGFPPSYETVELVMGMWFWSEFLTMLLNSKRRSLHDLLAGTVVLRGRP